MSALEVGENAYRRFVEDIFHQLPYRGSPNKRDIKLNLLSSVSEQIDCALEDLQIDEALQVTFRVDIISAGRVRKVGKRGVRNMPQYAKWRAAVYARDGYACVECGSNEALCAHHVKSWRSYPELRFDVDNGRTLCGGCHRNQHAHLRRISHERQWKADQTDTGDAQ